MNQTITASPRLVGRPKREDKDNSAVPAAERGTKPGEQRKSYIVNMSLADKVAGIAYWDRLSIKDAVNEAFELYVSKWEKKNGIVKLPKKVPNSHDKD